jgi:hypothetical protein
MGDTEQDVFILYKIIRLHLCILFRALHHFVGHQGFGEFGGPELFGLPVPSPCNSLSPDPLFQASEKSELNRTGYFPSNSKNVVNLG